MIRSIVVNKKEKTFWECREHNVDFWKGKGLKVKQINGIFKLCLYIKIIKLFHYNGDIYIDGDYI
jgi:hypothetical protein